MSTSEDKSQSSEAPAGGGMSCGQARRQIERLIEDCDLKDIERSLLLEHVRKCRTCKAELDSYRRLEGRLKEAFGQLDTAPHFSARVLAVLPEAGAREAPEWEKSRAARPGLISSRVFSSRGVSLARSSQLVLLRGLALTAGLAAFVMLAFGLSQLWRRARQTQTAPTVKALLGPATRSRGVDTDTGVALAVGEKLLPSDSVLTVAAPIDITLNCGPHRTARIQLAPGSRLQALNMNSYRLAGGAGYFEVRNDHPKSVADESFEVDAGGIASVRVTGTAFGVDFTSVAQGGVVVFVEEGSVVVRRSGQADVPLARGQELNLTATGPCPQPQLLDKARRLAWLPGVNVFSKPQAPKLAEAPTGVSPPSPTPAAAIAPPRKNMDWDVRVNEVSLLGRNLVEGIDVLAERLGKPGPLLQLRAQLQGPFVANDTTLSFSVHNEMPLRAVLRWMARDLSARFDAGPDGNPCFTPVAANELPGAPASGLPPENIRRALLETQYQQNLLASASRTAVLALVEGLSERSGSTIILDRPLLEKYLAAHNTNLVLPGQTVGQKLDGLLAALRASVAWYDGALYVAAPSRIEALTFMERWAAPGPQLLGRPLNPDWALTLKNLLGAQVYPPDLGAVTAPYLPGVQLRSESGLAGRPAFAGLRLDPNPADGPVFRYSAGLLGDALMSSVLEVLRTGSPSVPGIAGIISTPAVPGPVADIKALVEQARPSLRLELAPGLRPQPFDKQAFVNRNLLPGEALEWAAWLGGCGLRQESNDVWVLDDAAACYGAPAMQVLSLAELARKKPVLAPELPGLFTRLLPELYPDFFSRTQFRCICNRLVFTGDKRQLQLAQRVLAALEAANPASLTEARNWKPAWRVALEKNLAAPFQSPDASVARLSGSFLGLLRQSGLGVQLRCTVLVDPAAMREKAGVEIRALDVAGLSVGQVVERLAQAAGLRMVLEGEVVCLRP